MMLKYIFRCKLHVNIIRVVTWRLHRAHSWRALSELNYLGGGIGSVREKPGSLTTQTALIIAISDPLTYYCLVFILAGLIVEV